MGKLTKRISPIKWLSAPSLNFQQGQSGQIKVRDYVHDPQRLLPTITLNESLPTGCSFNGEDVSYDGAGAAASSIVTFTAATGTWSQTSSSTTCAIQAVQQNNPPVWASIPPQSVAEGYVGPVLDLANYCTDPNGDPITYGASGLPTGLTLQGSAIQADGTQVAAPATTITVTADDGQVDGEADWLARSTAAGVLWAHDFRDAGAPGLWWGTKSQWVDEHNGRLPFSYAATNRKTGAPEGVLGLGCMECFIEQGNGSGVSWGRPIAPSTGATTFSYGGVTYTPNSTAADVNNPGLYELPVKDWYSSALGDAGNKLTGHGGGGLFCHPDDYNPSLVWRTNTQPTAPELAQQIYGRTAQENDGFYIQYRVKFPTLPTTTTSPEGKENRLDWEWNESAGKMLNMETIGGGAYENQIAFAINHDDARKQVFFMIGRTNGSTTYGSPPLAPVQMQPGYTGACGLGSLEKTGCWKWPRDKWVTVLIHVIPGRNEAAPTQGWDYWLANETVHRNGGIVIKVAEQGATDYTTIFDLPTGIPMRYPVTRLYQSSTYLMAPGYSVFTLYNLMNPGGSLGVVVPYDLCILYDQIICSTQEIACPVV